MIKTTLKYCILTSTILLIGQIPMGKEVIGRHFQRKVFNLVDKALGEIKKSKIYSEIFSEEYQEAKNVEIPLAKKVSVKDVIKKEPEEVSQKDKESLMRLLK